ncbi:nuclear autoantigenic sperm protein isoform X3 [Empidonax traillii]|uniref:nuclear autoantigenic sperm protein isoform X3 n=1 Tax=Empidonax traillii TaxID=164674 RepID=UPI000FFDB9EB|nr:nuclear autoantigenic sperm protein isoform X3 [Empidonax traillii]XP_027749113.1 nuclear autoantigenic sperm protein isoform X3 [Empidonax traillii]
MQSSAVAAPRCVEPAPASATRMEEELAAPSTSTDKTESMDVDGESKKLLGLGQKHLVMGNIPAAVNAFQEAASLLGKKYGETADECAEAFFYYGKSLLELARMENGVLGNALEGVQVEEEGEKAEDDSALPAVNHVEEAREELREQVYNAMGEKEEAKKSTEESPVLSEKEIKEEGHEMKEVTEEKPKEEATADRDVKPEEAEEKMEVSVGKEETSEEQKQQVAVEKEAVKEEAAVEEKEVEKEQKAVPEDKVVKATEEKERTEVSDKEAKAAGEEAEAGEAAVEEKGEAGEQAAEATEKEPAVEKGEAGEGQAEMAVEEKAGAEEKAEAQAAAAVGQKEAAEGETEAAEQKKVEEKQESVETAMEEKPGESKETESSKEPVPTEGKEPPSDLEEKAEVAAKVEKEEKEDDLVEEGEGAKVEKEEKDDLMEEGEEAEESEEEDKENDKAEDDKENELTVEDKESEEDEIGNLELAWDMLELAKVIYKRQETKEAQLHAAQAHLKLGEVSIESENYTQAIEEFQSCLALQQKYLEAHDRLLAESHYQLALAYHYNSDFDEAVLQFGKSMEVIDKRLAILTERIKQAESGSPEDEKEIEELKGLLPEIKEKIEDSKESQKSARVAELGLKATLVLQAVILRRKLRQLTSKERIFSKYLESNCSKLNGNLIGFYGI